MTDYLARCRACELHLCQDCTLAKYLSDHTLSPPERIGELDYPPERVGELALLQKQFYGTKLAKLSHFEEDGWGQFRIESGRPQNGLNSQKVIDDLTRTRSVTQTIKNLHCAKGSIYNLLKLRGISPKDIGVSQ